MVAIRVPSVPDATSGVSLGGFYIFNVRFYLTVFEFKSEIGMS